MIKGRFDVEDNDLFGGGLDQCKPALYRRKARWKTLGRFHIRKSEPRDKLSRHPSLAPPGQLLRSWRASMVRNAMAHTDSEGCETTVVAEIQIPEVYICRKVINQEGSGTPEKGMIWPRNRMRLDSCRQFQFSIDDPKGFWKTEKAVNPTAQMALPLPHEHF